MVDQIKLTVANQVKAQERDTSNELDEMAEYYK